MGRDSWKIFFDGQFSFLLPRKSMYDNGLLSFSVARKSYQCTVFSFLIILFCWPRSIHIVLLINHNFYWQESLRILIIISHPEKPSSSIGQLSYFSWPGTFGLSNDQLLFFCFLLAWKLVYCTNDQLTCFIAGNPMILITNLFFIFAAWKAYVFYWSLTFFLLSGNSSIILFLLAWRPCFLNVRWYYPVLHFSYETAFIERKHVHITVCLFSLEINGIVFFLLFNVITDSNV
jgi:hypothetical protein